MLRIPVWLIRGAAVLALASLVVELGFFLSPTLKTVGRIVQFAVVGVFALDVVVRFVHARSKGDFLRRRGFEAVLLALLVGTAVLAVAAVSGRRVGQTLVIGAQVYLIMNMVGAAARASTRLTERPIRPALLLIGSYFILIVAGAILLLMPRMHPPGTGWNLIDAFFMSTSASCVTGLVVRDIGTELTLRGQAVLLALIQIGGLGLPTLAILASLFQQRALKLRQMVLLRDILSVQALGNLGRFLVFVLSVTVLAELTGAALLFAARSDLDFGPRLWWSVFHSVSAFCNAGFALSSDSLMGFSGSPGVLGTIMLLIVVGGIGFPVIFDVLAFQVTSLPVLRRWRWRWRWSPTGDFDRPLTRLSLHSRLVLVTTAVLIVGGAVLFYLAELNYSLRGRGFGEGVLASLFQSVTARTAGFNTVDIGRLEFPGLMLLMILMAVGASPVSTGGGVKTSSLAVLAMTVRSMLRGRDRVDAFGRTVPRSMVNTSVAIIVLYGAAVGVTTALLAATQSQLRFIDALFESISALSTVGLSTGVTAQMDGFGRLVVAAAMLVGRVGPLAILWTIVSRPPALRYEYPEEPVLVS